MLPRYIVDNVVCFKKRLSAYFLLVLGANGQANHYQLYVDYWQ